jgi:hypothetical protein
MEAQQNIRVDRIIGDELSVALAEPRQVVAAPLAAGAHGLNSRAEAHAAADAGAAAGFIIGVTSR